eukprot:2381284-Pyramimonas_sp.AAC.1
MIDYAIASESLTDRVTFTPAWQSHGRPTAASRFPSGGLSSRSGTGSCTCRRSCRRWRGPGRADPTSKSSMRREEARLARRGRLAPELREAIG